MTADFRGTTGNRFIVMNSKGEKIASYAAKRDAQRAIIEANRGYRKRKSDTYAFLVEGR